MAVYEAPVKIAADDVTVVVAFHVDEVPQQGYSQYTFYLDVFPIIPSNSTSQVSLNYESFNISYPFDSWVAATVALDSLPLAMATNAYGQLYNLLAKQYYSDTGKLDTRILRNISVTINGKTYPVHDGEITFAEIVNLPKMTITGSELAFEWGDYYEYYDDPSYCMPAYGVSATKPKLIAQRYSYPGVFDWIFLHTKFGYTEGGCAVGFGEDYWLRWFEVKIGDYSLFLSNLSQSYSQGQSQYTLEAPVNGIWIDTTWLTAADPMITCVSALVTGSEAWGRVTEVFRLSLENNSVTVKQESYNVDSMASWQPLPSEIYYLPKTEPAPPEPPVIDANSSYIWSYRRRRLYR